MTLEQRLAAVEAELAEIKAQSEDLKGSTNRALADLMAYASNLLSRLAGYEASQAGKN